MATLEESIAKAKAYGEGQIPIHNLPPRSVKQSLSGFCDYCNQERPMLFAFSNNQYYVCWRDICMLKQAHGEEWLLKVSGSLAANRERRLQVAAQKQARKESGYV